MSTREPRSLTSREWDEETGRIVNSRMPYAALGLLASLGVAWIVEHRMHPGRDIVYGLVYGFQIALLTVAILLIRQRPARAQRNIGVAIGTALLLVGSITAYHIIVVGEAEILALALAYLCVGLMILIPWGGWGQLIVSTAVVLAFLIAVQAGISASTPASINAVGLVFIGSVTLLCASALERYRRNTFWQAAELRQANADLQRANDALAAADAAKTRFLANLSHELRTPISIVIGYADLLRDGAFGEVAPDVRETIERIRNNSNVLLGLANDLLDLSRVGANKIELTMMRVPLAPLCAEAVASAQPLLRGKAIVLKSSVDEGLEVYADPHRLRQVLVNLLTNAAKYTERGRIELRGRASENATVALEVIDTGIGIPAHELEAIFEPFQRGSQSNQVGGAGIGLALSRRLTEAMGGTLSAISAVGQGSTFAVRLQPPPAGSYEGKGPLPDYRARWSGVHASDDSRDTDTDDFTSPASATCNVRRLVVGA